MRLVARVTEHAAGVFRCYYLRKALRLSGILLVTPCAKGGNVGQHGLDIGEIGDVRGLRTMAGLAGNVRMFAGGAGFGFVVVTGHTGGLAGEGDRMIANDSQSLRPEVAITAEVLRNNDVPYDKKKN